MRRCLDYLGCHGYCRQQVCPSRPWQGGFDVSDSFYFEAMEEEGCCGDKHKYEEKESLGYNVLICQVTKSFFPPQILNEDKQN